MKWNAIERFKQHWHYLLYISTEAAWGRGGLSKRSLSSNDGNIGGLDQKWTHSRCILVSDWIRQANDLDVGNTRKEKANLTPRLLALDQDEDTEIVQE